MSTMPKSSTVAIDISADASMDISASILSRVRVVMVETSHPGNVGSATRAMKTMGLTDLVLVAPKRANVLTHPDALALSASATDVLANTRIVATLAEAIADTCFALAPDCAATRSRDDGIGRIGCQYEFEFECEY
jgi:tRNA/rRNA methyltransferase